MTLHAGEDKVRLPDRVLVLPVIEGKENPEMEDDEVLLYPVPAGDYLKVEWKSSQEVQSVGLYNMTGMLLHKRSEEHTSELQSRGHLVCRLLLEKKKHDSHTL